MSLGRGKLVVGGVGGVVTEKGAGCKKGDGFKLRGAETHWEAELNYGVGLS